MKEFVEEIDRFLALTGMKETMFGLNAINDGKFVKKIRQGRRCWPETIDRVRSYMKTAAAEQQANKNSKRSAA